MQNIEFKHYTVMLNETIEALEADNSDKIYIDATLGGGGHSELILKKISTNGKLISFDLDEDAIIASKNREWNNTNFKICCFEKNLGLKYQPHFLYSSDFLSLGCGGVVFISGYHPVNLKFAFG